MWHVGRKISTMSENRSTKIAEFMRRDPYAHHLGLDIEEIDIGFARVALTVSAEQTNFHGSVHGGIIFTLADIAFSLACNSHGQTAVGLNVDISYLHAAQVGDRLIAEARELSLNGPIGLYELTVKSGDTLIAQCQAMAYRKRDRFVE